MAISHFIFPVTYFFPLSLCYELSFTYFAPLIYLPLQVLEYDFWHQLLFSRNLFPCVFKIFLLKFAHYLTYKCLKSRAFLLFLVIYYSFQVILIGMIKIITTIVFRLKGIRENPKSKWFDIILLNSVFAVFRLKIGKIIRNPSLCSSQVSHFELIKLLHWFN